MIRMVVDRVLVMVVVGAGRWMVVVVDGAGKQVNGGGGHAGKEIGGGGGGCHAGEPASRWWQAHELLSFSQNRFVGLLTNAREAVLCVCLLLPR